MTRPTEADHRLGSVWISLAGSDAGTAYLLVGAVDNRFLLWDGKRHRTKNPKQKNPAHCLCIASATTDAEALASAARVEQLTDTKRLELDARARSVLKKKRSAHVQRGCH